MVICVMMEKVQLSTKVCAPYRQVGETLRGAAVLAFIGGWRLPYGCSQHERMPPPPDHDVPDQPPEEEDSQVDEGKEGQQGGKGDLRGAGTGQEGVRGMPAGSELPGTGWERRLGLQGVPAAWK